VFDIGAFTGYLQKGIKKYRKQEAHQRQLRRPNSSMEKGVLPASFTRISLAGTLRREAERDKSSHRAGDCD
jgi:hypothetical protein